MPKKKETVQVTAMKVDKSVKFAWAYLLMRGKLTDGTWSYYGGCWEDVKLGANQYVDWETKLDMMNNLRADVLIVGIDWSKTGIPTVTTESAFRGTFADTCDYEQATLGKLVLLNGDEYLLGSNSNEAASLVEAARMLIAGKSEIQDLANKL